MHYQNPILPGFYPDPSICRVNDDYYLATSTFEYFPGVPIFHSKDLVNWRQLGHCLTRASQLPLEKLGCSAGIYAPTLRYHNGLFYMVTLNVAGINQFFVTAKDPAGPWSEPILLEWRDGGDPSLFFDDDGKCYYTVCHDNGIWQVIIDPATGKNLGKPRHIWTGTGGRWPEAPHLYKINGRYYLLLAENGTDIQHIVTIARSDSPWGPWEHCPYNPILTHSRRPYEIQGTGHADLVQTQDGQWWAVFLAFRISEFFFHHMGRETFMAPVHWTSDGWPIIGGDPALLEEFCKSRLETRPLAIQWDKKYPMGSLVLDGTPGTVDLEMPAPSLPPHPWPQEPARDDFDKPALRLCWNFLRNPREADWSLTQRPGFLRLNGSAVTLNDVDSPAFVGRRQQHFDMQASTRLEFRPQAVGEEAGLTVLIDNQHHYEIAVTLLEGHSRPSIIVRRRIGDLVAIVACEDAPQEAVILQISSDKKEYCFSCAPADRPQDLRQLARGKTKYLSTEVAITFTGVYLAMYATGNGARCTTPADFDWFEYRPGLVTVTKTS